MTIRETLKKENRKSKYISIFGWVLMAIGIFINSKYGEEYFYIPLIGFVIMGAGIFYASGKAKCPKCSTRLGDLVEDDNAKFCPHCGVNIDEEYIG